MQCFKCLERVNKRETQKILKSYGRTFDELLEPICADCAKYILENHVWGWFRDEDEDYVSDSESNFHYIPIDEAAAYYACSGDPDDTYGYTVEELEEYLRG